MAAQGDTPCLPEPTGPGPVGVEGPAVGGWQDRDMKLDS